MSAEVKDEEILMFLDDYCSKKFERKIFNEIKEEITIHQSKLLTPENFSRTYYNAYSKLKVVIRQVKKEIDSSKRTGQDLSSANPNPRQFLPDYNRNSFGKSIGKEMEISNLKENNFQMSHLIASNSNYGHGSNSAEYAVLTFEPIEMEKMAEGFMDNNSVQTHFGKDYLYICYFNIFFKKCKSIY